MVGKPGVQANKPLCCSRSRFFCTLPMVLRGNSVATKQRLGILKLASCDLSCARMASPSSYAPGLAMTTATPTSPKSGCGTPTTALSATPGMSLMALSISAGKTL